eukprot:1158365-Pelagomonas_calceolata.AAC.4
MEMHWKGGCISLCLRSLHHGILTARVIPIGTFLSSREMDRVTREKGFSQDALVEASCYADPISGGQQGDLGAVCNQIFGSVFPQHKDMKAPSGHALYYKRAVRQLC